MSATAPDAADEAAAVAAGQPTTPVFTGVDWRYVVRGRDTRNITRG